MLSSLYIHLIFSALILLTGLLHARSYFGKRDFSIAHIAFWISCLFFGVGPWVTLNYGGSKILSESDPRFMLQTYVGVVLFLLGLLIANYTLNSLLQRRANSVSILGQTYRGADQIPTHLMVLFYVSIWFVRLLIGLQYGMFVSGTQTEENITAMPYSLVVSKSILEVMAYGCLLWGTGKIWKNWRNNYFVYAILIGEFIWLFLQGRRWLLAYMIILGTGFVLSRRQIQFKIILPAAVIGGLLLVIAFPVFYEFRLVYWENYDREEAFTALRKTMRDVNFGLVRKENQSNYRENMQDRALIIGFNRKIMEAQEEYGPMYGKAILSSLLWTVPSVLSPNKFEMMKDEETIQEFYRLQVKDTSSNWAAFGCADFGVLGGLIAGLILGGIISGVETAAGFGSWRSAFLPVCFLGGMMMVATSVEETPELMFSTLRSLVILYGVDRVLHLLRGMMPFAGSGMPGSAGKEQFSSDQGQV